MFANEKMKTIKVNLGKRGYPIYLGVNLEDLGKNLIRRFGGFVKRGLIVTNPVLRNLYGVILKKSLNNAGYKTKIVLVPDGEKYKSFTQAEKLYRICLEEKLERRSPLIAFGGGVIGDLAGFVAATFLRGIPLIQVPTTLVAQVDSSIGGKVAVDLPEGKNLVGAFYQPSFVWIDLKVLKTLPLPELRNGLAEVIKYAIINNGDFFSYLEKNLPDIGHPPDGEAGWTSDIWTYIVSHSCQVKAKIVEKDELEESGLRRILNFGHTLGHALETITKYRVYKHGEAVSIGMACATRISEKMNLIKKEERERIVNLLKKAGLPTEWPGRKFGLEEIYPYLEHDKKVKAGKINFVLPVKIGKVVIRNDIPKKIIQKVLNGDD